MHAAYSGNPVSMSDIKKEPACGGMLVFMRLVVHASVASCMTCLYLMQLSRFFAGDWAGQQRHCRLSVVSRQ